VAGTWALLTLPTFAYAEVHVEGTETIPAENVERDIRAYIEEPVARVLRRSNRFLFDADVLRDRLAATYPFDRITVEAAGKGVQVRVRERQSELLWRSADQLWLVDLQGLVIRTVATEELGSFKRLQTFVDVNDESVVVGGTVLSAQEVSGIRQVQDRLLDLGVPFTETRVDRLAGQHVAIHALLGYDIIIDPLGDPGAQADRLAALLRDTIKQPASLQYVDLRFGDHVYYK
jgi:hypothetical protein